MMATRLEDNREVWWLEGVLDGLVGLSTSASLHYRMAYCSESACSAFRDLPFCLKQGCFVAEQKSGGTGWVLQSGREVVTFRELTLSVEKCRLTRNHDVCITIIR
jgi:hypothetical protein